MTVDPQHELSQACHQLTAMRAAADVALDARLARLPGGDALRHRVQPSGIWLDLLFPVLTAPSDTPELLASIRVTVQWAATHQLRPHDLGTVMRAVDWVLRDLLPATYSVVAASALAERSMLLDRIAARSMTPRDTAEHEVVRIMARELEDEASR